MRSNATTGVLWGVGGILAFFGVLLCVSLLAPPGLANLPMFLVGLPFLLGGIACFVAAGRRLARARRTARYLALIDVKKRVPLQWLEDQRGCDRPRVIRDLRRAMQDGCLEKAHIDEKNGQLLLPGCTTGAPITRFCPRCGAGVEALAGYSAQCSYCGAQIDADGE